MNSPSAPPCITTFIGGGNMARSLISGLIARGHHRHQIRVAEPVPTLRNQLQDDFGVQVFADAGAAVAADGDTWVFAVKPQVMRQVSTALATVAQQRRPLVISIAAGITADQLQRWLGGDMPVVRTMPNTPALLGAGITGLYANTHVDATGRERAQTLLASAGSTVWVDDETLMDAVTAVSGSGPAYVFLLAEAMQAAGEEQGLSAETARVLTLQTILGAARMLLESGEPAVELRHRVTSPGGTTQAALEQFEQGGFRDLVARAISSATERGRALSAAHDG